MSNKHINLTYQGMGKKRKRTTIVATSKKQNKQILKTQQPVKNQVK